jgi:L-arabinose isomerase
VVIWYIFPVLVFCTKKNLATLIWMSESYDVKCSKVVVCLHTFIQESYWIVRIGWRPLMTMTLQMVDDIIITLLVGRNKQKQNSEGQLCTYVCMYDHINPLLKLISRKK